MYTGWSLFCQHSAAVDWIYPLSYIADTDGNTVLKFHTRCGVAETVDLSIISIEVGSKPWRRTSWSKSVVYNRNRIGRRTDPCGTPHISWVGVDELPLVAKRGRCEVKRYGCIITCLVIQAIHIEIVYSLDISSFLNELQRFICRRKRPVKIRSDNDTNFKGAERELKEAIREWNKRTVRYYLHQKEIEWKFNPPTASPKGRVWERQIRTVRKVLSSLTKEQTLDDKGLSTLVCKAEEIVNSRPLTTVSGDPNDLEALTPNYLGYWISDMIQCCRQEYSRNQICSVRDDGNRFSTWQTFSGADGSVNVYCYFRVDKNGLTAEGTLKLVMLCW